ncbi:hypothetical protein HY632_00890 [Candidatus Uhrbacteria bacterium]|nr:hypothetical protein [Candidatus Uhrbacteria bacterium]
MNVRTGIVMARLLAREILPVLLILFPVLLMLDDVEPGFVRSVVNPYIGLPMLLLAAMLAAPETTPCAPSRTMRIVCGASAVLVGGGWVSWRVGGGVLGVLAGLLTGVAIAMSMVLMDAPEISSDVPVSKP